MKMRKFKKGFTLVELVVVIAVIAVLAAVSVGAYFGVTESAKVSAATNYLKQVKDLYMVFSVSEEYDEDLSERENAEYFAAEHIPYNGLTVDVNYRLVNYYPDGRSNAVGVQDGEAVLFKVESEYPSWFVVKDKNIVVSSEIYKTEEDFENSLIACDKIQDENNNFSADTFYLVSLYDETNENNKVRGYKYVEYIVNTYDIENNLVETKTYEFSAKESLYHDVKRPSYNPDAKIQIEHYPDNTKLWNYFNEDNTIPFETDKVQEIDDTFSRKAIVNGEELNRGYLCETIIVNQISNTKVPSIENYPVLYVNRSQKNTIYKFYSSIDSLVDQGLVDNENSSTPSFVFLGETTLSSGKIFNVKKNHNLVVDFLPVVLSENGVLSVDLVDFLNPKSALDKRVVNNALSSERLQMSQMYKGEQVLDENGTQIYTFNIGESDYRDRDNIANKKTYLDGTNVSNMTNKFTVDSGATINFNENSMLFTEALVSYAGAQSGTGILDYGYIENNGSLNFYNNSTLRSLGRIGGNGSVNMYDSSEIIDLFKLTTFYGGTITVNYFTNGIFPFSDYCFDNIQCLINIYEGSSYTFISGVYADKKYSEFLIKYIAPLDNDTSTDNNALFMYHAYNENDLVATLKYIDTEVDPNTSEEVVRKITRLEFLNCDAHVRNININLGSLKGLVDLSINTACYNFPVSNTDIVVDETASLNIGENSTLQKCSCKWGCDKMIGGRSFNLEFLPNSSLKVEGKLNLSASTGTFHRNDTHYKGNGFGKSYGQTDIPYRDYFLGDYKVLSTDAETLLKVEDLTKTELSFQNFTEEQIQSMIDQFIVSNTTNDLNIYLKDLLTYFKNNLHYWNTNRSMLAVTNKGSINFCSELTNATLIEQTKNKIDIYAVNAISNYFSIDANNTYLYKYQTAFKNGIVDSLSEILASDPSLAEYKTFTLQYSFVK